MDVVKVLEILAPIVREHEGLRLHAYKDPVGIWTIGYGHTKNVKAGMTIDEFEAELLLLEDMTEALSHTLQTVPELATQHPGRIAAITDFTYNLGVRRLETSTLCKVIRAEQWDRVPGELRRWVYGTNQKTGEKVKLNGLIKRREAECSLWSAHGARL